MIYSLLLLASILTHRQDKLIERAAFMQGCWERRTANRIVEEQWLKPRGGTMLGMSRTVRGDSLVEYEFLRLYQRGEQLVFAAQPSGQSPAEFMSTSIESNSLTFSNPAHDFPQRISYRASGDSLFARVEGERGGQVRGVDFRYARCAP